MGFNIGADLPRRRAVDAVDSDWDDIVDLALELEEHDVVVVLHSTFDHPLFFITSPYIAHCMGACSAGAARGIRRGSARSCCRT